MIPISLKIQGFLSFRDITEINFRELYEDGIFLIAGPTGSGKTSLFDAISFALYGEAPTSGRKSARELRSDYIGPDDPMSVEFAFEAAGHEYHIRRWQKGADKPLQQRFVRDGNEAEAMTKISEIRTGISDILGLTADQFSKIVMLPQGEFQSFLVASSKDKSEILRRLFDTEQYAGLRDRIREKLNELNERVKEARTLIDSNKRVSENAGNALDPREIERILRTESEEAQSLCRQIQKDLSAFRETQRNLEFRLHTGQRINRELAEKNRLEEELAEAVLKEKSFLEAEARAEQLNRIRPLSVRYGNLEETKRDLAQKTEQKLKLTDRLDEIKEPFESVTADYMKNPQRQQMLQGISREKDAADQLLKQLKELDELLIQEKAESSDLLLLSRRMESAVNFREEREQVIKEKERVAQDEIRLNQEYNTLKDQYRDRRDLLQRQREYQDLARERSDKAGESDRLRQDLSIWRQERDQAETILNRMKENFQKQGLSQFSHLVLEGSPCPLCGSLHHPAVLKLDSTMEDEDLGKKQEELDKLNRAILTAENDLTHHTKTQMELTSKILAMEKMEHGEQLREEVTIGETQLNELAQKGNAIRLQLDEVRKHASELEDRKYRLEQNLADSAGLSEEFDDKKQTISGLRSRITGLKDQVGGQKEDSILERINGYESEEAKLGIAIEKAAENFRRDSEIQTRLETSLQGTLTEIKELMEKIGEQEKMLSSQLSELDLTMEEFLSLQEKLDEESNLRKQAKDFFSELQRVRNRLDSLNESLEGDIPVDLASLTMDIETKKSEIEHAESSLNEAVRRETRLNTALGKVTLAAEEYEKYGHDLEIARKLDNTTGKGTTFENYVLGYYLDRVLIYANTRLRKMTGERFALVRQSQDSGDQRAIEGLNIHVFDTYSNSKRDVKTLSGGESFKASLAMALGLSDFIQENRSGIRLDTIFIDEGFGSLDQESLDSAMETILEIQGQGRLVGIISHVEELKERIPAQLTVRSNGPAGSSVRIVKH